MVSTNDVQIQNEADCVTFPENTRGNVYQFLFIKFMMNPSLLAPLSVIVKKKWTFLLKSI